MTTIVNETTTLVASDGVTLAKASASYGNYLFVSGRPVVGDPALPLYIFKKDNSSDVWTEIQKIIPDYPPVGHGEESFGLAICTNGDFLFVSTPLYGSSGSMNGQVIIYKKDNSSDVWTEVQRLGLGDISTLNTTQYPYRQLGTSLAVENNILLVGSPGPGTYDEEISWRGHVYVFEKNSNNDDWSFSYEIEPNQGEPNFSFGKSVAISGNYAIIGDEAYRSPYVYFFKKDDSGDGWTQIQKTYSNYHVEGSPSISFGNNVAISGNFAMISEHRQRPDGGPNNAGLVHVFKKDNVGDGWTKIQEITSIYISENAFFGVNLALKNNTAIISGNNEELPGNENNSGMISMFKKNDNNDNWTLSQIYALSNPVLNERLGRMDAYELGDNFIAAVAASSRLIVFPRGSSVSADEQSLIDLNIDTADIDVIKAATFSNKSNGKGNTDTTSRAKLQEIIAASTSEIDKRKRRRSVIKLMFAADTDITKMVIPKSDLDLPAGFTKTNALVIKAGGAININSLESDEGFYSVLNDGENVSITTENTTLTFSREDVGDTELYEVSATTWTDIVINTDNVTGTFDESNKTGTLVPGDTVTIDGRSFIIGSIADGGSSSSGGDPYVFSIKSNTPVKLPNKSAVYRMFEQNNNYVNVEVGRATDEHKLRMFEYAKLLTPVTHNIVMDGYFYQKAFISAEGHRLTIDYTTKKANCDEESAKFFTMKQSKKLFDCGEFKEDASCWTVGWTTKENKKIHVQLMFFPNPHIENGINVIPSTLKNSTGLIVDNYKPKLMEIPNLTTEKFGKLQRKLIKSKNIHQKMNIKGKNEKWHFN
jgi:hypothetical protein